MLAEPGGIHQTHGQAGKRGFFFQIVARGARLFRDDGALTSEKGVHEAGFAGIHLSGQHHQRAFAPAAGPFVSGKEGAYACGHFLRDGGELLRRQTFAFLVGKVDGKADALTQVFQTRAQLFHPAAEQTVQLGGGKMHAFARGRGDELGHGFGLRKIHAAVQKGAPREFSSFRHARAA